jgi:hypothetical protein
MFRSSFGVIDAYHEVPNSTNVLPSKSYITGIFDKELFLQFAYLFGDWTNYGGEPARQNLWVLQRKAIHPITYNTTEGTLIVVERGDYFSSYERIKYLVLPYLDVPINKQVFLNGEKARTDFSSRNEYPGLFTPTEATGFDDNYIYCYEFGIGIQVSRQCDIPSNNEFLVFVQVILIL